PARAWCGWRRQLNGARASRSPLCTCHSGGRGRVSAGPRPSGVSPVLSTPTFGETPDTRAPAALQPPRSGSDGPARAVRRPVRGADGGGGAAGRRSPPAPVIIAHSPAASPPPIFNPMTITEEIRNGFHLMREKLGDWLEGLISM